MKQFVIYYTSNKKSLRLEIEMDPIIDDRKIKGQDVWNHVINLLNTKHNMNTVTAIKIVSKTNDFYSKADILKNDIQDRD